MIAWRRRAASCRRSPERAGQRQQRFQGRSHLMLPFFHLLIPRTSRACLGWDLMHPALILFLPVFFAFQGMAQAHDFPTPERVRDQDVHRPTALPDRIVLTWSDDPATTQAVTWRTSTNVQRAYAQIAVATSGPQTATQELVAVTEPFESDLGVAHYHGVEFRGLQPSTLYAYRVGDATNWSEWLHFRTAKSGPAPFTFLYIGDAQNDIRTHWSRVFREAFREAPRAAFTLHAGDLVNVANRDAEWGEWFGAPGWVNAVVPVLPTPGNHEYAGRRNVSPNLRLWDISGAATLAVTVARTQETNASGSVVGTQLRVTDLEGRSGGRTGTHRFGGCRDRANDRVCRRPLERFQACGSAFTGSACRSRPAHAVSALAESIHPASQRSPGAAGDGLLPRLSGGSIYFSQLQRTTRASDRLASGRPVPEPPSMDGGHLSSSHFLPGCEPRQPAPSRPMEAPSG